MMDYCCLKLEVGVGGIISSQVLECYKKVCTPTRVNPESLINEHLTNFHWLIYEFHFLIG